jgi:hypothetical protein
MEVFLQKLFKLVVRTHKKAFWKTEGENVCFLASCAVNIYSTQRAQKDLKSFLEWSQCQDWFDSSSPCIILSRVNSDVDGGRAVIDGYSDYDMMTKVSWEKATNIMVAQGLLYWARNESDKLQDVITSATLHATSYATSNAHVSFIYFVTHIILLDSHYGRKQCSTDILFPILKTYLHSIRSCWKQNIEIWIELLFCLSLEGSLESAMNYKKDAQDVLEYCTLLTVDKKKLHQTYHTLALCALLSALLSKKGIR